MKCGNKECYNYSSSFCGNCDLDLYYQFEFDKCPDFFNDPIKEQKEQNMSKCGNIECEHYDVDVLQNFL